MASKKKNQYVIVRSYAAGVFAGELVKSERQNGVRAVVLNRARRLWYWSGAASLSQLAAEGVKNASACKFAVPIDGHEIENVIEVIPATAAAKANIAAVPEWKQ